jgi:hypothetical protein
VHGRGLSDKAVVDIVLDSDSEEDFGSDNKSELIERGSQYESQSDSKQKINSPQVVVMQQLRGRNEKWKDGCKASRRKTCYHSGSDA